MSAIAVTLQADVHDWVTQGLEVRAVTTAVLCFGWEAAPEKHSPPISLPNALCECAPGILYGLWLALLGVHRCVDRGGQVQYAKLPTPFTVPA